MGPTVNNLDSLLQMPYGCGEQNMITFAPDVFVTKYLKETNQLTPDIEAKALKYMESGEFNGLYLLTELPACSFLL
jgi:CD109 antigen